MVARKQYFELIDPPLDADSHMNLKRRELIPFPSEGKNDYSLFDAFTMDLAGHLAAAPDGLGMNRIMARNIVRDCGALLIGARQEIEEGAKAASDNPVFAGRIHRQGGHEPFVGSKTDLASALTSGARVIDVSLVNVSLAFAAFRARCERVGVDMHEIWSPDQTVAGFDEMKRDQLQPLRDAVQRSNQKRKGA